MPGESNHVAIGLCTFRRPQVADTIRSLGSLNWPEGTEGSVIVADNDDHPTARIVVEQAARQAKLSLIYLHAPARNISVARNAVLDAAEAKVDYLAFLDDDEAATPNWIRELLRVQEETKADVVLGTVRSRYNAMAPEWMRRGQFHDTLPTVRGGGRIVTGYTCNVLLHLRAPAIAGRRFHLEFGCTGGEDTLFFSEAHAAGARISYAACAVLVESIPAERASMRWLMRRRYRMGHTHARVLTGCEDRPSSAVGMLALAKAVACGGLAFLQLPFAIRRNRAILRAALHLGTLAAIMGIPSIRIYGASQTGSGWSKDRAVQSRRAGLRRLK